MAVDHRRVHPQLDDYAAARSSFGWDAAREALVDGAAGNPAGLNIADLAVDRHVRTGHGDAVALRWLSRDDERAQDPVDITYSSLALRTNRFASALHRRGFPAGTGVATLAGRIPELYVSVLGALKAHCVVTPLFAAFGPDPIAERMNLGRIKVLVTTPMLFRRKIAPMLDRLHDLELIVIACATEEDLGPLIAKTIGAAGNAAGNAAGTKPSVIAFGVLLGEGADHYDIAPTDPDTPALLHFTSGTTGTPKGAIHAHGAVVAHHATGQMVLDLRPGDVYWCTADPGWVTGTSYGIIAPLTNGVTSIIDEAVFDAERWYGILRNHCVDVWYTAPTAIRMLARLGRDLVPGFPALRLMASVGEPLDAESVLWCEDVFKVPVLDTWWQTETGSIMIANFRSQEVRPGSMGRPIPGVEAGILQRDANGDLVLDEAGQPIEVTEPDVSGELALRTGWPSMFRGYLDREERYRASFTGEWYRSGDLARKDADGYYWFVGRGDDVIKTAGHLIGPFEVESALNEHPAVAETGVIGKPDETAGAIVKAFVVLVRGVEPSEELRRELLGHARSRLGAAVAPREIDFASDLPHTRSGKIMRRVLKARELGEDEGDISTLENASAR
jgi:acetyl-CoA synthetase